ncbi:MAG: NAD(P)-dependent oxidoreductase [Betaproteobacteria bacterium]|nr:NAD(P)-dependent oxidoreductase [Betaproteobacteria bacterium]
MGAAVGACAVALGHRVAWASAGRSGATAQRARAGGLEDAGTMEQTIRSCEVILAICPPHGALELARSVARAGFQGLYLDANAISPDATREVGRIVEAAGARFVDGGIVGPPPRPGTPTRLYVSGPDSSVIAELFADSPVRVLPLAGPPGTASALKVCYAAWTKGTIALAADIRALALHEGVEGGLLDVWAANQPDALKKSDQVALNARKAWRWVNEMEQIAASFEAAGLPGGFHRASADIYARQGEFKDAATPPPLEAVLKAVIKAE